jgi:hypothetical protein
MATRTSTRKTSRVSTASASSSEKPFCGVCFNSGKNEKLYTSHFTKSVAGAKGIILCPTILQHTCEYCKEKGHFKSNCRVLKQKEKMNEKTESKEVNNKNIQKILNKTPAPTKKNRFSLAFDDSDGDDEVIRVVNEEKTPAEVIFIPKQYKISYSMIANTPVKEKRDRHSQDAKKNPEELNLFNYVTPLKKKNMFHSWADDDYWASDDE